jgi:hypothetical protein
MDRKERQVHCATPRFPVEVGGVGELHATFFSGKWRTVAHRGVGGGGWTELQAIRNFHCLEWAAGTSDLVL